MNIFKKLFGRKDEGLPTSITYSAPVPNLGIEEQNACHKILALRNSPAQILGTPFKSMSADEFKQTMGLTMSQVHLGPGYKPEIVDYVLSGQYEIDKQETI